MATTDLTLEQVRALAEQAGLGRYTDEHLQQLMRTTNASRARVERMRLDKLTYADEPAHVFAADAQGAR
jgi:demethoxyubiquinone hydroxylase (CLK1/Coq7/Cat5 family)